MTNLQGLRQIFPTPEIQKSESAGRSAAPQTGTSPGADEATLSPAASLAARSNPDSDVRMEKVVQVQQALAAGTYRVQPSDVADKMIDGMLKK